MKPGVPWSVKGIDADAREAAKAAARESGMTLGEWLNSVILESADEEAPAASKPAHPRPPARPARKSASGGDDKAVRQQLDQLADKLSSLTREDQKTAVNRFAADRDVVRQADLDRILARIESSERNTGQALEALTGRLETLSVNKPASGQSFPSRPEDVPGYKALESALRNLVDHMTVSERQTREALQSMQSRLTDMAAKASTSDNASVVEQSPAFSSLEKRLADLAHRLEVSERNNQDSLENLLDDRLGQFVEQIDAVRHSTDTIAQQAQSAAVSQAQKEARQIEQRVEQLVAEARTLVRGATTSTGDLQRIQAEIGSLNQRFDDIKSEAASDREVQGLKSAVEQLAVALNDNSSPPLEDFEQRLHDLHRRFEETAAHAAAPPQIAELDDRIRGLDEQLAAAMQRQGDSAMTQALESQLATIGDRLQATESKLDHLDTIEKSIQQLFTSLDETREWSERLAQDAAGRAAAAGSGVPDLSASPEIRALEEGLEAVKASTASADERTQETLEAVHETLEQIIEKLTEIDAREAAERLDDQAQQPEQQPHAVDGADQPVAMSDERQFDDPFATLTADPGSSAPAQDEVPEQGEAPVYEPQPVADAPLPPAATPPASASNQTWQAIAQARLAMQKANQASVEGTAPAPVLGEGAEPQLDTPPAGPEMAAANPFAPVFEPEPQPAPPSGKEDYIAAARRAALSAAPRSPSPVINTLNYMTRRLSDGAEAETGGSAKRRFGLPFLNGRSDTPSGQDETSGGGGKKRLIIAGLLLLAAVSAYAYNTLGKSGGKAVSLDAPAVAEAPAGTEQQSTLALQDVLPVPGLASPSSSAAKPPVATGMPDPAGLQELAGDSQLVADPVDQVTTSSLAGLADGNDQALLQRKAEAAGAPGATATGEKADPSDPLLNLAMSAAPPPPPAAADLPESIGTPALRDAALKGNAAAQFVVASRFLSDKNGTQDLRAAARWYQKAAAQGLAPAQYRLGTLFERGKGVPQDATAARMWYERAAEGGNVKAMHNLAVLHTGPAGGSPDYQQAAKWFTAASKHGLKDSMFNLAVLHERGLGVERNAEQAMFWFELAARAGDKDAADKAAALAGFVEAEKAAKIKADVAAWTPQQPDRKGNLVAIADPAWEVQPKLAKTELPQLPDDLSAGELVLRAQSLLNQLGYDAGPADGVMGSRTANAVRLYQLRSGIQINGMVTRDLVQHLMARSGAGAST